MIRCTQSLTLGFRLFTPFTSFSTGSWSWTTCWIFCSLLTFLSSASLTFFSSSFFIFSTSIAIYPARFGTWRTFSTKPFTKILFNIIFINNINFFIVVVFFKTFPDFTLATSYNSTRGICRGPHIIFALGNACTTIIFFLFSLLFLLLFFLLFIQEGFNFFVNNLLKFVHNYLSPGTYLIPSASPKALDKPSGLSWFSLTSSFILLSFLRSTSCKSLSNCPSSCSITS